MAIVSAAPKCDATTTQIGVTEWGTRGIPCQTTVGLRSFLDREGVTRYVCPVPEHRRNVERRFGRAGGCFFCGREDLIQRGLFTRVTLGTGVVNLCDICREKGTEDESDD